MARPAWLEGDVDVEGTRRRGKRKPGFRSHQALVRAAAQALIQIVVRALVRGAVRCAVVALVRAAVQALIRPWSAP